MFRNRTADNEVGQVSHKSSGILNRPVSSIGCLAWVMLFVILFSIAALSSSIDKLEKKIDRSLTFEQQRFSN